MAEWLTLLDRLDIPDGAVTGLSASDKPVLKGKLLQLPAADRPLFFDGPPLEILKTLRTLLPDAPSGKGELLLHHASLAFDNLRVSKLCCVPCNTSIQRAVCKAARFCITARVTQQCYAAVVSDYMHISVVLIHCVHSQ